MWVSDLLAYATLSNYPHCQCLTILLQVTEYKHTEDYLKRKTIEKYVSCFADWPPCSWPVTAHAPFTLLTLRMCSYWLRTWRPHRYPPFAYAIKQTPYAFVSKIILCMYLLYVQVLWGLHPLSDMFSELGHKNA